MIAINVSKRSGSLAVSGIMTMLIHGFACGIGRADVTPAIAELRSMSTTVVQKVVKHLQANQKPVNVKIGAFTSVPADKANTGGLLANEIKLAFGQIADNSARIVVFGTYTSETFNDKDAVEKTRIKVTVRLMDDTTGKELVQFNPVDVKLANAINTAQIQGVTAVLPIKGALPVKNKDEPFIGGTQIKAFQDSPYAIEILKRPRDSREKLKTTEPELVNGKPFVPLFKGEIVQVRVLNYSNKEIGASLKLDGVDQFALSEVTKPLVDHQGMPLFNMKTGKQLTEPRYRAFIIGPSNDGVPGETILTGWHINDQVSEEFEQVALGQGVRSLFPELVNGPVGVISVGIANTKVASKEIPMVRAPGRNLPPEPSFNVPPPEYSSPRFAPPAYSRQPNRPAASSRRIPDSRANDPAGPKGSAPPFQYDRPSDPSGPKSSAPPQQSSPKHAPEERGEFKNGRKFDRQVQEVDRMIEDPNTIITVRYHR